MIGIDMSKKTKTVTAPLPVCIYKTVSAESAAKRVPLATFDANKTPTLTEWCRANFAPANAPTGENFKRYRGRLRNTVIRETFGARHYATLDALTILANAFPLFRLCTDKTVRDIAIAKHGKIS